MSAIDRALAKAYGRVDPPAAAVAPPLGAMPPAHSLSVYREAPVETTLEPLPIEPLTREPADASATIPLSRLAVTAGSTGSFRPLLEVDRFTFPKICDSLLFHGAALFDRLTSELVAAKERGQKGAAFVGCTPGSGCTTALLTTAKQLAAQGLRCALVDADPLESRLASTLGVATQGGWDDVLSGELTLGDVVVASIEDRLALVPQRRADSNLTGTLRAAANFDMLREYFDLLLLESGSAGDDDRVGRLASRAAAMRVEGAYLVYDCRDGAEAASRVARRLERSGLTVLGAIENFASRRAKPKLTLHRPATA